MKVLIINGSPRRDGNSDSINGVILGSISRNRNIKIKTIFARDLKISGCVNSEYCYTHDSCYIKDGMQDVYKKILWADRIIVISPVYFYNVPSQLKVLIDRCQCFWVKKYIKKEKVAGRRFGMIILIAGSSGKKVFDGAHLTIKYFFDVFNTKIKSEYTIREVDRKGDINKFPKELEKIADMSRKFVK